MIARAALIAVLSPLLCGFCEARLPSQDAALFEDGFEGSAVGEPAAGWFGPSGKPPSVVIGEGAWRGERCAQLDLSADDEKFGNLMISVPIELEQRTRVSFSAAVRVDGDAPGRAQLWLRFDYDDGERVLVDNMGERPIQASDWSVHRIVADAEAKPGRAMLGMMVFDGARAQLDEVRFDVLASSPLELEAPRPLDERGLANLVAFARLLGYVRYFHPSDEAAEADWNRIAIEGVRRVEGAADAEELLAILNELFAPIAPAVAIHPSGEPAPLDPDLLFPPADERVSARAWRHRGLGDASRSNSIYSSQRLNKRLRKGVLPEGFADPAAPFAAELGAGLSCALPLTLYATDDGTLPQAVAVGSAATDELALTGILQSEFSGDDRATRLAAVLLGWNVFQHFYPYFDVVEVDWQAELVRALRAAAEDEQAEAFAETLERMVAALQDGHGGVYSSSQARAGRLPLDWDLIEGELVVTWVDPAAGAAVTPGEVVSAIGGVPVDELLAEIYPRTSAATPQFREVSALRELGRGPFGEPVELMIRVEGEPGDEGVDQRPVELGYVAPAGITGAPRPGPVVELEPGIWYVDLDRASTEEFVAVRDQIAAAEGVIFDMRGYPSGFDAFQFFPHLTREPVESARWMVPIVTRPDRAELEWQRSNWTVQPAEPYITARRVFITDGQAISYAESCMGIVEHYELGEIVGEATAGTNGNVNPIQLPGGYRLMWTGMRVLKQDGAQHHGVGILPTVPVARTRAGIAVERDELLEAALERVRD